MILLLLVGALLKRVAPRLRIVRQASLLLMVGYTILDLLFLCIALISTLAPRGLFLDPAVKVTLNHQEELNAGADPVKSGIRHRDGFTLNIVIRDEHLKVAKIGETFLMGLLEAVYGFLTIRYSDRSIAGMRATG
jgi:hypothetical protein